LIYFLDQETIQVVSSRLLVHKCNISTNNIKRGSVIIDSTEIALAFPIDSDSINEQQPIFAFLPVCSYGFRFIIQADWVLAASR
jgi:hypothetical protein